jgi:hypothetical protein
MTNKTYYLFGSKAVRMYHNDELSQYARLFDHNHSVEMSLFEYNDNVHQPSDLLEAYDGWDGYAVITEEEYKLLKAKQDNEQ